MELFAIHCTTCKARLAVKDESVIGDILACPKCGGMVQIVPPTDWKPPAGSTLSAEAPASANPPTVRAAKAAPASPRRTEPADSDASRSHDSQAKGDSASATPEADRSASRGKKAAAIIPPALPVRTPPPVKQAPVANVPQQVVPQQAVEKVPELASVAATPALTEPPTGVSSLAKSFFAKSLDRARQDWLLLSGGLAGGVLVGGLVWFAVWMISPTPAPISETALAPDGTSPAQADVAGEGEPNASLATEKDDSPSISDKATPPESATPEPVEVKDLAPASEPSSKPADDPLTEEQPADSGTPVAEENSPSEVPETIASADKAVASKPAPSLKLEPVAPSMASPSTSDTPEAGEDIAGSGDNKLDESPDESSDLAVQDPPPDDNLSAAGALPVTEIEKRLGVKLQGIQFRGTPLSQFTAFIEDITGVPVMLDDAALVHVGKNRKSPIELKLGQSTAADALQAASQSVGLAYSIEDGRILISAPKQ